VNVVKAGANLGIRSVKFTGGEPLMREDLEEILAKLPPNLDVSLTTNGIFLAERAHALAEAGLDRVNVSLDSLRPETYSRITGGSEEDLKRVLEGIDAAIQAGLTPVKVNVVVLKENEDEIWDLIDFAREKGVILQLIELLNLNNRNLGGDLVKIEQELEAQADRIVTRDMHRRRKYFLRGGEVEVEVVRPIDNTEFCEHCNRLRVTSDGKFKPCLLRNDNLVDIDSLDPEDIKRLLEEATARRKPYFVKSSQEE
jgi:cyclic pyranopterin phosphate synthase